MRDTHTRHITTQITTQSEKMYWLATYTDIKDELLKYLRARTNIYHWIVGTTSNQNHWFIWHHENFACFSHTRIGKFLWRNKAKFITQYCSNKRKPPVGKLYAYTKDISETDMIQYLVEKTSVLIRTNATSHHISTNKSYDNASITTTLKQTTKTPIMNS